MFSTEFDQLGIESGKVWIIICIHYIIELHMISIYLITYLIFKVQELNRPITSISKLLESNHVTIIYHQQHKPLGYIKVGYKDLFFYQKDGKIIERKNKLCLLDFYVSESIQRNGIGLLLFQTLLNVRIYILAIWV